MKRVLEQWAAVCFLAAIPGLALAAFDSGSTGADGPFNPTVNTAVQLPPSGVFNYTTVNIPAGVTVTFIKNAANTPAVILAGGDVVIAGTLNIRAGKSADTGAGGDGNVGDDGLPGVGGPGGFDGGRGGLAPKLLGSSGVGPGAGHPGSIGSPSFGSPACGGGGGGYSQTGSPCACIPYGYTLDSPYGTGGVSYGSSALLPLIGGSGGGGGTGGSTFTGSGGGGGGGAILIASSATVNVTGSILADGGASGVASGAGSGVCGGGGSGGAIRIVANTISGNGSISAIGGLSGSCSSPSGGGAGAAGRIRLEASTITRTAATTPTYTTDLPGSVFVAGAPTLAISSVAGVAAPATPTGNADIVLPTTTVNPVTVTFTTTGVPTGNTIKLTVTPASGAPTSVVSPALTGSTASAGASVQVTLPQGTSVLQAQTTYTIVAALGDAMSRYAGNERVERVTLTASPGKPSTATLHTITGKEYQVPAITLASLGVGF